jgi:hypothetical protein
VTLRAHPERVVARIEMAWSEGDLTSVLEMIHPNASLVPRTGGPVFAGRELFVRAFRRTPDFTFERKMPGAGSWQTWGETAVFDLPIAGFAKAEAQTTPIAAREVWVLARDQGIWSVVWLTMCDRPAIVREP